MAQVFHKFLSSETNAVLSLAKTVWQRHARADDDNVAHLTVLLHEVGPLNARLVIQTHA